MTKSGSSCSAPRYEASAVEASIGELYRLSTCFLLGFRFVHPRAWRRHVVRGELVDGIVKALVFDGFRYATVVGPNRAGKSVSVLFSVLLKLLVCNVENFCVVVALQNHMQLEYARDVVLNCLNALRSCLGLTWEELRRSVRVRYYRGQESACLLNRLDGSDVRRYWFGDDRRPCAAKCLRCPLYLEYRDEWDRLPGDVFYSDNDVLAGGGFCPFRALFHRSFWYKSVVLIPHDLLGVAVKQLVRFKIRRVVIIVDEYLDVMVRRIEVPLRLKVDVELEDGEERAVVNRFVNVLTRLIKEFERSVDRRYAKNRDVDCATVEFEYTDPEFLEKLSGLREELVECRQSVREVVERAKRRGDYMNYAELRSLLRLVDELFDLSKPDGRRMVERSASFIKTPKSVLGRFIALYGYKRRSIVLGVGGWLRSQLYDLIKSDCYDCFVLLISSMTFMVRYDYEYVNPVGAERYCQHCLCVYKYAHALPGS